MTTRIPIAGTPCGVRVRRTRHPVTSSVAWDAHELDNHSEGRMRTFTTRLLCSGLVMHLRAWDARCPPRHGTVMAQQDTEHAGTAEEEWMTRPPKKKVVHKAHLMRDDGSTSALCYRRPRPIDYRRANSSLVDWTVTCPKCLALLPALPACP